MSASSSKSTSESPSILYLSKPSQPCVEDSLSRSKEETSSLISIVITSSRPSGNPKRTKIVSGRGGIPSLDCPIGTQRSI